MISATMLNKTNGFYVFILIILCIGCGKKTHEMMTTEEALPKPVLTSSNFNINVTISRMEINDVLNEMIRNTFQDGFTYEDGYKISTKPNGPIDLQAIQQQLIIQLPIAIELIPSGIFNKFHATGGLKLQLVSQFEIFEQNLLVKTEIKQYQWTNKPVVQVLGLKIPIEGIANYILKKYKQTICNSIDESIMRNIRLDQLSKNLKNEFQQPVYSSDDHLIHVYANPTELAVGPMQMNGDQLQIPVIFYFESVLSDSMPGDFQGACSFSVRPHSEMQSNLNIQSRIPISYIEQRIRQQVEQQSFGSGVSKVKVNRIQLSAFGKYMTLELNTEGSFKGDLVMRFKPQFDDQDRKLILEEFSLKAKKGVSLNKILFSLFKGIAESRIKNSIEDQLNLTLKEFELNAHKMLDHYEWVNGIVVAGSLLNYSLKNIQFYDERLYFNLEAHLNLEANIQKINRDKLVFYKL